MPGRCNRLILGNFNILDFGISPLADSKIQNAFSLRSLRLKIYYHSLIMKEEQTMKTRFLSILVIVFLIVPTFLKAQEADTVITERRISVSEYRSKMKAGWIGQMAGVGWGFPTEFRYQSRIIPEDEVPEWKPEMINVYDQDDLYVEMTFMRSMEVYGFDLSINQAGIDFANSKYMLWVANRIGRANLRKGIAPPNSGHPANSKASDAIDYQIEADFSGLVAPGLPNIATQLGEKFGRLMNYGDGLYGGQFVGAMYAEAFFESDPLKIVEVGLKSIPAESQYAEAVRDVIQWHAENPDDWEATWELINKKYHENPDYRQHTYEGAGESFNIDAKLNGAYIVMGLLYGERDPDKTIVISMRCGQDSDCNPSNAAGILFTTMKFEDIPEKFISGLDEETKFSFTEYSFPALIDVSEKLAREAVTLSGGRIENNEDGEDVFVVPISEPVPSALEQSWEPGPLSDNTFSDEELAQIEGHWIFNYALIILLVLAFLLFKENRNLKTLLILIPLIIIYVITSLLEVELSGDALGTINFLIVVKSLAVGIAILLLLGHKITTAKWYFSILIAMIVLAIAGFAGITGADDGRIIALSKANLTLFDIQAGGWLLGIILAVFLCRKKFGKLKFNLYALLGFFIFQMIIIYLASLLASGMIGTILTGMAGSIVVLLITSFTFTIIVYLVTLPFLILVYRSSEFEQRFQNWIGQTSSSG
jgi:hypothetical protein